MLIYCFIYSRLLSIPLLIGRFLGYSYFFCRTITWLFEIVFLSQHIIISWWQNWGWTYVFWIGCQETSGKREEKERKKEKFNEKFLIVRILFLHWPAGKTGWTNHITSMRILMFTAKQEHLLFSNDRLNFARLNHVCVAFCRFFFF